jgi:hypothetical protein
MKINPMITLGLIVLAVFFWKEDIRYILSEKDMKTALETRTDLYGKNKQVCIYLEKGNQTCHNLDLWTDNDSVQNIVVFTDTMVLYYRISNTIIRLAVFTVGEGSRPVDVRKDRPKVVIQNDPDGHFESTQIVGEFSSGQQVLSKEKLSRNLKEFLLESYTEQSVLYRVSVEILDHIIPDVDGGGSGSEPNGGIGEDV